MVLLWHSALLFAAGVGVWLLREREIPFGGGGGGGNLLGVGETPVGSLSGKSGKKSLSSLFPYLVLTFSSTG